MIRTQFLAAIAAILAAVPAVTGCGGGLQVNLVEAAHREPSNVAVFFTVDTSAGDPVPGLLASDFRIYEDGELVSVDESRQTIVNPEVAAEHYTLLLVDMSGSVTESDQVPLIVEAAAQFTTSVEAHQKVAVYAFDGSEEIHPIAPFSRTRGGSAAGVARLATFRTRDPSTNLHGGIVQGIQVMNEAMAESTVPLTFGTMVIFTDGSDRAARVSQGDMYAAIDDAGFDVFAIGVGNEIDDGTLGGIGRDGYVRVQDAAALQQAFADIGQKIIGYTQRFYLLSYCSPARAGVHEVTIEAIHGEESGELTYEFDATGFGPNCNPATPPPFDVSGRRRGRVQRARSRGGAGAGGGVQVEGSAGATVEGGAQ